MCGIAGFISLSGPMEQGQALDTVTRMTATLRHRGPDDHGEVVDGRAALGCARLSIIDLPGGHQPISDPTGTFTVVHNGEIYNYREVRAELETRGHRFQTSSDTEVVLEAYREWGPDCLHRLNGMFATAIWDSARETAFIVRDRLGIKPLYYSVLPGKAVAFASEPKALFQYPGIARDWDLAGVMSYLEFRYPVGDLSFYRGVVQVPAGAYLTVAPSGIKLTRYWDVPRRVGDEPSALSEKAVTEQVRETVASAVRYRMIADVPVCAFISGGLDSSIVLGTMSQLAQHPVLTYTTGFAGDSSSEVALATNTARHYGSDHHVVEFTTQQYLDATCDLIAYRDGPLGVPNEAAVYLMSREIKKKAKVVLSGEGADELFAGYGQIMRSASDYDHIVACSSGSDDLGLAPDEGQMLATALRRRYGSLDVQPLASFFLDRYSYMSSELRGRLLCEEFLEETSENSARAHISGLLEGLDGVASVDRYLWIFEKVHLQGLLARLDNATMAAGVEARGPFLDHRLVEYAMQLPVELKMKWRSAEDERRGRVMVSEDISDNLDTPKYILRKAFETLLPPEVAWRKKEAFSVPLEKLARSEFEDFVLGVLTTDACRQRGIVETSKIESLVRGEPPLGRKTDQVLWMLANVELWLSGQGAKGEEGK